MCSHINLHVARSTSMIALGAILSLMEALVYETFEIRFLPSVTTTLVLTNEAFLSARGKEYLQFPLEVPYYVC